MVECRQLNLFDFMDTVPEEKPAPDFSGLVRYEEPRNDNERLLNFQYDYRREGKSRALDGMYLLGKTVAAKYITDEAKKNRHVKALPRELREEKAANAITYIILQYTTRPDFCIWESFTGYLYLRVRHELYYHTEKDRLVQFCDDETIRKIIDRRCTAERYAY